MAIDREGRCSDWALNAREPQIFVSFEWLESLIGLDLLDGVLAYEELTAAVRRYFHENKAEESKEVVTLDVFNSLVDKELRIDMADSNTHSPIDN